MGLLNFDARTVAPFVGFDPLPEGWYRVVINKSNIRQTKSGDSGMLVLELLVIEGQYKDRILFYNLNLWNTNTQATEIAYKQLSAIMHVIGVMTIQDSPAADSMAVGLHNIPFFIHAVIVTGEKGTLNNIKGVKDVNGNDPKVQPMVQAQPSAPAPGFGSQAPAPAPAQPSGGPSWSSGTNTAPAVAPAWAAPAPSQGQPPAPPQNQPAWLPQDTAQPAPPWGR